MGLLYKKYLKITLIIKVTEILLPYSINNESHRAQIKFFPVYHDKLVKIGYTVANRQSQCIL